MDTQPLEDSYFRGGLFQQDPPSLLAIHPLTGYAAGYSATLSNSKTGYTLTDTQCRTAKPKEKPYELTDGNGVYLELKPNGVKAWRYRLGAGII